MIATGHWRQLTGRVVDTRFVLGQFLGGSEHSGVFLTERKAQVPLKAVIKLVPAKPASADLQLARWQEAATFTHPRLLRLFESGRCELEGTLLLYLVMEYAEENLAQILPERALTTQETSEVLLPLVETLGYLHNAGFVHSHLAPSNILVVEDQLKFSSDGIVRINELTGQTKRGPYDAPEAATMTTSPAGDIWALGMITVEALTQRLPRAADSAGSNGKLADLDIPASLPEPFQEIARNSLRADPQRRWTIDRIAARLQAAGDGAATVQETDRSGKSGKRGLFILLAIAILALIIGAAVVLNKPHGTAPSEVSSEPPAVEPSSPAANPAIQKTSPQPPPSAVSSHGTSMPDVVRQVLPPVAQSARNTIQGKVRVQVRVDVDSSGNVVEAAFVSPGPSKYFARLAITAAQQWKFVPSADNAAARAWVLKFAFGRKATEVSAVRASKF